MRNKREEMTLPFTTNISLEDLEPSTLSANDKAHLKRWLEGVESGRACMLAMLDASHAAEQERSDAPPESAPPAALAAAGSPAGPSLELALLSASVNLPADFLCTGFLYEHVFSKPPVSVVREALHLLLETAQESEVEALDCHQINLAIKQVRIDNLARAAAEGGDEDGDGEADAEAAGLDANKENRNRGSMDDKDDKDAKAERHRQQSLLSQARLRRARDEETRLQIMVELIHLHAQAQQRAQDAAPSDCNDDDGAHKAAAVAAAAAVEAAAEAAEPLPPTLLARDIHSHLLTPLEESEGVAAVMPAEELEQSNALLKPYISRLAALREALRLQLAELEKNEAFFALGLAQGCDCSDAQIKRAYHSLAVRLHPDKGGLFRVEDQLAIWFPTAKILLV